MQILQDYKNTYNTELDVQQINTFLYLVDDSIIESNQARLINPSDNNKLN